MKKIIYLLFGMLIFCGNQKKEVLITDVLTKQSSKREYYVSVVPYVNHDDYYVKEANEKRCNCSCNQKHEDVLITEEPENIIIETSSENDDEIIITDEPENIIEDNQMKMELEETITNKNELNLDYLEKEEKVDEIKLVQEEKIEEIVIKQNETKIIPKGYYSPSGKYLGETKVKVIDVSEHQGIINWDRFAKESDCYGVILRIGYYNTLDKQFKRNISEIKRLGIPYGIYLFSYAKNEVDAKKESDFTNKVINEYKLEPTLGIFYDIESWTTKYYSSNNITKNMYDNIVTTYINDVKTNVGELYQVGVYSGRWYAMNRLGLTAKSYVSWVAEYNSTCKYDGNYKMWQYTSKGRISGIKGNVDINYLY